MTGIIVLAAGESKRFGAPKQLANYYGKPLIRHSAETAVNAQLGPVNIVLGAVDQPCREVLAGLEVTVIHNPEWEKGMSSSIVAGLRPWLKMSLDGVIILLADQPNITPQHLQDLEAASPSHAIVASKYDNQLGVPAWFSRKKFRDLLALKGEKGAKALIEHEPHVHWLDAPFAAYDIDTPADLASAQ